MTKKMTRNNIIITVVLILASLFFRSWPKTVGIAIGAILMTLNFISWGHLYKKLIETGKLDKKIVFFYLVKMLVLFILVALVLLWPWVSKMFFILGIIAIIASFMVSFIFQKREGA